MSAFLQYCLIPHAALWQTLPPPQDLSALQCEVCVLVFSVTDRRSFHRTAQLRLLLRETQPQTPIILVGNKSDLVRTREVTYQGRMDTHFPGLLGCFRLLWHLSSQLLVTRLSLSVNTNIGWNTVCENVNASVSAWWQCGSLSRVTVTETAACLHSCRFTA